MEQPLILVIDDKRLTIGDLARGIGYPGASANVTVPPVARAPDGLVGFVRPDPAWAIFARISCSLTRFSAT